VRQNPIQRTVSLFICVCIALCTIVAHNIAQNRPDSFPPYPPDNHHCSDDVYLREGGKLSLLLHVVSYHTTKVIANIKCHGASYGKLRPKIGCRPSAPLNSYLTHDSLGLSKFTQTASRSVKPFLQGSLVWQTDRQTDRPTDRPRYSVGNNRPHLRT